MQVSKLLMASALCLLAACAPDNNTRDSARSLTLFENAAIISLNNDKNTYSAMVIDGNKIKAVGEAKKLRRLYPNAFKIDLAGSAVLPGIIDSHVHVRELGMDRIKANLVGAETTEQIIQRIKAHFPNPVSGDWLVGQGWDEGYFAYIGYPDRALLDEAFPDNPVALESLHGFGGFYNGQALKIAGINKATPDPEVGDILRRKNGEPTGIMLTLAQDLVDRHIPEPNQARVEEAIVAGLNEMAKAGVTSVHEAGMTPIDIAAFKALAARDALPIRVYGLLDGNDDALMKKWFSAGILDDPEDWLDIRGIKVFYDGSLGSRTALMQAPYSDKPDTARPTERISPSAVTSLGERAAKHGFQMAVHAIGDEGNNRTLSIYETALKPYPAQDHRWRIEHAQVVLPDYYSRAAALGVISSIEPSHAVGDSGWAEDRVGPERIRHAYAWQNILGAGGKLMVNSDLPGEPWTPMETLYFAVTRKRLDGSPANGWYAEQALSVEEALYGMTRANAHGAFQDQKLGQLAPGYWADFIVLDQNPLETKPNDLKTITVTQTWVAGKKITP